MCLGSAGLRAERCLPPIPDLLEAIVQGRPSGVQGRPSGDGAPPSGAERCLSPGPV